MIFSSWVDSPSIYRMNSHRRTLRDVEGALMWLGRAVAKTVVILRSIAQEFYRVRLYRARFPGTTGSSLFQRLAGLSLARWFGSLGKSFRLFCI